MAHRYLTQIGRPKIFIFLIFFGVFTESISAQPIITSHGVFNSCTEAIEYREGALVTMLDQQFERYRRGVQERVEKALDDFEKHRYQAQRAYKTASEQMRKMIALAVGKYLAAEILSDSLSKLPADIAKAQTPAQKNLYKAVVTRLAEMKIELSAAIATGEISGDIVLDSNISMAADQLAEYLGPVGSITYHIATASLEAAAAYWQVVPIQDQSHYEALAFAKAIEKLAASSPQKRLESINNVKSQIDEACSSSDVPRPPILEIN